MEKGLFLMETSSLQRKTRSDLIGLLFCFVVLVGGGGVENCIFAYTFNIIP